MSTESVSSKNPSQPAPSGSVIQKGYGRAASRPPAVKTTSVRGLESRKHQFHDSRHYDAASADYAWNRAIKWILELVSRSKASPPVEPKSTEVPAEVLDELAAVQDEAREEGYPVPSNALVDDVRDLLDKLCRVAPLSYTVYPMEKGEIAIDARNEPAGGVVLLCHERETWCIVSIGDSPCRAWFRDRDRLPEAFITSALTTLASGRAW